jgi:hypothetical protein
MNDLYQVVAELSATLHSDRIAAVAGKIESLGVCRTINNLSEQ